MKYYTVTKFTSKKTLNYGRLPESDVKALLKGYKYDEDMELWFSPANHMAYEVIEEKN